MPGVEPRNRQVLRANGLATSTSSGQVITDLTLTVNEGEVFGLVGPPGTGKSLALACLAGLTQCEAGHLRIFNLDPAVGQDKDELQERRGVMPRRLGLPDSLRVGEALSLFNNLYSRSKEAASPLWERLGLTQLWRQPMGSLSLSQKQRLSLSLALQHSPQLLFADQPTSKLEQADGEPIWQEILKFRASGGTVVLTTPVVAEAENYCDAVALLDQGEIVVQGCPRRLLDRLRNSRRIVFQLEGTAGLAAALLELRNMEQVLAVVRRQHRFVVIGQGHTLVSTAIGVLAGHGVTVADVQTDQPSLGDLFVSLTGRSWASPPISAGKGAEH